MHGIPPAVSPTPKLVNKRKKKLIIPSVQVRLTATLVGIATVGMLLQFLFLGARLTSFLSETEGGAELAQELPGLLVSVFLVSLLALLPVMTMLGVAVSFRFAGPLHRFHEYLQGVARGDQLGPCRLREGDQLQHICDAINEVTEPLRRGTVRRDEEPRDEESPRRSA